MVRDDDVWCYPAAAAHRDDRAAGMLDTRRGRGAGPGSPPARRAADRAVDLEAAGGGQQRGAVVVGLTPHVAEGPDSCPGRSLGPSRTLRRRAGSWCRTSSGGPMTTTLHNRLLAPRRVMAGGARRSRLVAVSA